MKEMLLDFNDITIIPEKKTDISSRSECNCYDHSDNLPIFTAPMSAVVDTNNYKEFLNNNIIPIIPRTVPYKIRRSMAEKTFVAISLVEAKQMLISRWVRPNDETFKICIDIANGHMKELLTIIGNLKSMYGSRICIMSGNIANPETYFEYAKAGADYVRCNVGSGNACTTAANSGLFYPTASLIMECKKIKNELEKISNKHSSNTFISKIFKIFYSNDVYKNEVFRSIPQIIADGGMSNFDRMNKALACGADYIMLGQALTQTWESAASPIVLKRKQELNRFGMPIWEHINKDEYTQDEIDSMLKNPNEYSITKTYYGMSTKRAQRECGNEVLKTAEGISKQVDVTHTLSGWVDNYKHYLRSIMSYTNTRTLDDFKNISLNAFKKNGLIQLMSGNSYFSFKK